MSGPRLAPLPPGQWDDRARDMLRGKVSMAEKYLSGEPGAPPMPNILGVLGHHPELASAWLSYNGALLERSTLDARYRELVILRVALRTGSEYEWIQHVRIGAAAGLTAEQIERVRLDPAASPAPPAERLLVAAADELVDGHTLTDATWAALTQHFGTRELLELLFVAGSYLCLALVFNTVGLQIDPGTGLPEHLEHLRLSAMEVRP
ncbi:MAG: carboxymuconolactone decarboxylase family protein [Nocardia sp.]|nr:carboxymuconolactone decarboxylase family protein [Nocardia sp.]